MTELLTRDVVLAIEDLPSEDVLVPEWGGVIRIRGLTAGERDRWEIGVAQGAIDYSQVRAYLVAQCAVDGVGKQLFRIKDIPTLARKSGVVLDRLFDVAERLSGLRQADLEELEGN